MEGERQGKNTNDGLRSPLSQDRDEARRGYLRRGPWTGSFGEAEGLSGGGTRASSKRQGR